MKKNTNNYTIPESSQYDLPNSHPYQSSHTYNNRSWYVEGTTHQHGPERIDTREDENGERFCGCWKSSDEPQEFAMNNLSNQQASAANMVASYGVYHDVGMRADEEGGFVPRRSSAYRGVVVNASGGSTVMRAPDVDHSEDTSCSCWCFAPQAAPATTTTPDSCWMPWCRPTILLLILILLVVVFVLVSGILLYFNYVTYNPRQQAIDVCKKLVNYEHISKRMISRYLKLCRCIKFNRSFSSQEIKQVKLCKRILQKWHSTAAHCSSD